MKLYAFSYVGFCFASNPSIFDLLEIYKKHSLAVNVKLHVLCKIMIYSVVITLYTVLWIRTSVSKLVRKHMLV